MFHPGAEHLFWLTLYWTLVEDDALHYFSLFLSFIWEKCACGNRVLVFCLNNHILSCESKNVSHSIQTPQAWSQQVRLMPFCTIRRAFLWVTLEEVFGHWREMNGEVRSERWNITHVLIAKENITHDLRSNEIPNTQHCYTGCLSLRGFFPVLFSDFLGPKTRLKNNWEIRQVGDHMKAPNSPWAYQLSNYRKKNFHIYEIFWLKWIF